MISSVHNTNWFSIFREIKMAEDIDEIMNMIEVMQTSNDQRKSVDSIKPPIQLSYKVKVANSSVAQYAT